MKIYQSTFISELVIKEKLTNGNTIVNPIKIGLIIKKTVP